MSNTPSDAEIEALAQQHLKAFAQFRLGEVWFEGEVEFARAVLAKWGTPQPSPAAQGDAIEHELAMLIRRIVSSARRNCEDGSNVLKLANEAWAYLVRKGLNGSPLRDAGIESDPTPPAKAADSVLEDAARYRWLRERSSTMFVNISINGEGAEIAATLDSAVDAARKQGASHD